MFNTEKTNIVVVDDDISLSNGLRRQTQRFDSEYRIHFMDNAVDVLHFLNNEHVDVLVSEVRTCDIGGVELMKFVAEYHPEVVRIILSGRIESRLALQLSKFVHQYFTKPCDPANLLERLSLVRKWQSKICDRSWVKHLNNLSSIPCPARPMKGISSRRFELDQIDISVRTKILQIANSSFLENTGYHSFGDFCVDVDDQWQSSILTELKPADPTPIRHAKPYFRLQEIFDDVNMRIAQHFGGKCEFQDTSLSQLTKQFSINENCAAQYLFAIWGIEPKSLLMQQA